MSILAALSPYKLAAEIAVFSALAAGVAYGFHQYSEHEREIGRQEIRAADAKQLQDAKDAALAQERFYQTQLNEANKHATEREQTIRALAAASGAAYGGLRDTIATISNGLSTASADALRNTSRAYGVVFAECAGRRDSLAEDLERSNSEKQQLIEAWPHAKEARSR